MCGYSPVVIGLYDSGVGGLTVLAECVRVLPGADYLYFADSGFAPYGNQTREKILKRSILIMEDLKSRGIKAVVVACNTATSSAIDELRCRYRMPVIGMEPALKPAVEQAPPGDILVLGTPFTIHERKYRLLLDKYRMRRKIVSLGCEGIVELIEQGKVHTQKMKEILRNALGEHEKHEFSGVVLGCTHYIYIRDILREVLQGNPRFFDGNVGTARQLKRRLPETGIRPEKIPKDRFTQIRIDTSGNRGQIFPLCETLLKQTGISRFHLYFSDIGVLSGEKS